MNTTFNIIRCLADRFKIDQLSCDFNAGALSTSVAELAEKTGLKFRRPVSSEYQSAEVGYGYANYNVHSKWALFFDVGDNRIKLFYFSNEAMIMSVRSLPFHFTLKDTLEIEHLSTLKTVTRQSYPNRAITFYGEELDNVDFFGGNTPSLITDDVSKALAYINTLHNNGIRFRIDCRGNDLMSNITGHYYISNSMGDEPIEEYVIFLYNALVVDEVEDVYITPDVDFYKDRVDIEYPFWYQKEGLIHQKVNGREIIKMYK